jgi:signal transduction histidine kinase
MTLFQQFALAASVVLCFAMIAVGAWMSARIADGVLRAGAGASALYMSSFFEPHIQSLARDGKLTAGDLESLAKVSSDLAARRQVASIKIWRPDGTIIYSTQSKLIGHTFSTTAVEPALRGEIRAAMASLDEEDSEFERNLAIPLYEVIVPLYKSGTGEIIAVGEFYGNAGDLVGEMSAAARSSWLVVAVSALVMLGGLSFIVYRGSGTIERQRELLKERLREQTSLRLAHSALEEKMRNALGKTARIDEQAQRRLGAELHDGPVQLVSFVLLRLDEVRESLVGAKAPTEVVDEVRRSASQALKDIRSIAGGLLLPELDDESNALEAVRRIVAAHQSRTNSTVSFQACDVPDRLPPELVRCIGRVTQEALTNAFKHAGAVEQVVSLLTRNGLIRLSICDGGPGFEPARSSSGMGDEGLGLVGMKYRVESVGGNFEVRSDPSHGTEILARFPYQAPGLNGSEIPQAGTAPN